MKDKGVGRGEWYVTVHGRDAVTLVEMLVVLVILGLIVGVSGLALASLKAPRESETVATLRRARTEAIRIGSPVGIGADHSPLPAVLFLPDGRAIGLGVDPLTGAPRDSLR